MPDITLEEIQKKFDSLPENLRLAILIAGADKKINSIGREHGLNVKQIGALLLKTHIMMFGFIHPDMFENSVKEIPGIPLSVVKGIVRDVNEQIIKDIKDDLIELAEKPEKTEEVEPFQDVNKVENTSSLIQKETVNENILKEEKENLADIQKNSDILKQAGITINPLSFGNEISIEKEINEDQENTDILKSAGIEINSLPIKEPEGEPKIENYLLNNTEETKEKVDNIKENEEVMKIAFQDLPVIENKIEKQNLNDAVKIQKKEQEEVINIIDIKSETKEIYNEIENNKKIINEPLEIPPPPDKKELSTPEKILEIPPPLQTTEITSAKEKTEISSPLQFTELEAGGQTETIQEEIIPEKPTSLQKTITEEKQITKEEVSVSVPENETTTKIEQNIESPAESKKTSEAVELDPHQASSVVGEKPSLKISVQNIISHYQVKEPTTSSTPYYSIKSNQQKESEKEDKKYNNIEEEKRFIVMQIVEIQEKMKTIKERTAQIEKELLKLEKNKKEIPKEINGDNTDKLNINKQLTELHEEEKIVQKLRENDLPKEYLSLLEKLDKLTNHNNNPLAKK
jgi:hypothetical protein